MASSLYLTVALAFAPLWPGSRFTEADRSRAIHRGLEFIYRTAKDPANFAEYGSDYLWCFYEIASTSADPKLRAEALKMGRERAREWLKSHRDASSLNADDLADLLFGAYAAERLGFPDPKLKEEIRRAASNIAPKAFLGFDPAAGPSRDLPKLYDQLCDALITTYTADQYGVTLGVQYREAVKWLPLARPYQVGIPAINLVTHVVYTMNDYQAHPISAAKLPDEFEFLKAHLFDHDVFEDSELLGEFVDTLRAFGMTMRDAEIRRGHEKLLSAQNPDGSWGDPHARNAYHRYHATWTAIDGLRDYRW